MIRRPPELDRKAATRAVAVLATLLVVLGVPLAERAAPGSLLALGIGLAVGIPCARLCSLLDYRLWRHLAVPVGCMALAVLVIALLPAATPVRFVRTLASPGGLPPFAAALLLAVTLGTPGGPARIETRNPRLLAGALVVLLLLNRDLSTVIAITVAQCALLLGSGRRPPVLLLLALVALTWLNTSGQAGFVVAAGAAEATPPHGWIAAGLGLGATALFAGLLLLGLATSIRSRDAFARFLGSSIVLLMGLSFALGGGADNSGRGTPEPAHAAAPFVGTGGVTLALSLIQTGILLSVARATGAGPRLPRRRRPTRNRGRPPASDDSHVVHWRARPPSITRS